MTNSNAVVEPDPDDIDDIDEVAPELVPPASLIEALKTWVPYGICAQTDPEAFFPEKSGKAAGKRICANCPVSAQCLDYAMVNNETFGIWGGKSPYERRQMRKAARLVTERDHLDDRGDMRAAS